MIQIVDEADSRESPDDYLADSPGGRARRQWSRFWRRSSGAGLKTRSVLAALVLVLILCLLAAWYWSLAAWCWSLTSVPIWSFGGSGAGGLSGSEGAGGADGADASSDRVPWTASLSTSHDSEPGSGSEGKEGVHFSYSTSSLDSASSADDSHLGLDQHSATDTPLDMPKVCDDVGSTDDPDSLESTQD